MDSPASFVLTNAKLVLADAIIEGWVAVADGKIAEWGEGIGPERGLDVNGDYVAPGLIELHTDHLEAHIQPRPKVRWDTMSAALAYDAQIAASGVTTVFDSLRIGAASETDALSKYAEEIAATMDEARESRPPPLRTYDPSALRNSDARRRRATQRSFIARRKVHLISLMDHTPGQRQFRDLEKMRTYYARHGFVDDADFRRLCHRAARDACRIRA